MSHEQAGKSIVYKQIKPSVIVSRERVAREQAPFSVLHEQFVAPAIVSSIEVILESLRAYFGEIGFTDVWIDQFVMATGEALINAVQGSPPQGRLRGLLVVISGNHDRHCSLFLDNDLCPDQVVELKEQPNDFEDRLDDLRGRGFDIMNDLLDGLAITVVPGRFFQAILEKDSRLTDVSKLPPLGPHPARHNDEPAA